MLVFFFSWIIGLSLAEDSDPALQLLQAWQAEVAGEPYQASISVKIEQERKQTQIIQNVTGELFYKDARHAKASLVAESLFPDRGPQLRSIKPVHAQMEQVMDGKTWWVHVVMEAQNFERVMQAELDGFEKLVAIDQSGGLGMSLPIMVDPSVLVQILSSHDLSLDVDQQTRTIQTVPSANLLRSFNLPVDLAEPLFLLRFPSKGFYPLQIEVKSADQQPFALKIHDKRALKPVPSFEFAAPEGVQVVDILLPFAGLLNAQESE